MFDKLKGSLSGAGGEAMEKHLDKARELVKEHLGPQIEELKKDEEKLKAGLKKVYPFLPMPARLVISEEKFVEFCVAHKDKVL